MEMAEDVYGVMSGLDTGTMKGGSARSDGYQSHDGC